MDENLNAALNSLDMLATVTNARREYLAERRFHNICSLGCVPLWRASNSSTGVPTKENQVLESAFFCCGPRRQHRSRTNMETSKLWKPFQKGFKSSTRGRAKFTCGSPPTTSTTRFNPLRLAHHQHPNHQYQQQHHHHHHYQLHHPHHLHNLDDELKSKKTEKFPVPLLFRSKSLEDLRDTSSSSASSSSSIVSNSISLSHPGMMRGEAAAPAPATAPFGSHHFHNMNNFIDFGPRGLSPCTNNINIKMEIDSMSMRIEKLDVA